MREGGICGKHNQIRFIPYFTSVKIDNDILFNM